MSEQETLSRYPSVVKPWLKCYSEKAIQSTVPQCTVYEQMLRRNRNALDTVALIYHDIEITYGTLFRAIDSTATSFSALGINPGDVVTICSFTIPEVVCSFYALNKMGAVCIFFDPRTNDDRIIHHMKETQSRIALVWEEDVSRFQHFQKRGVLDTIIVLSPLESMNNYIFPLQIKEQEHPSLMRWKDFQMKETEIDPPAIPYQKDYPAVVLFTGGTTGVPKGVLLSNDAMNAITVEYDTCGIEYSPGQRFLNIMPPFVASGLVCGINMILGLGLTSILVPMFSPNQFADLYLKYRPDHVLGAPAYLETLLQISGSRNADLSFIHTISVGGDELHPETEVKLNHFLRAHHCSVDIGKGYGLTELGFAVTTTREGVNKTGSVGIPLPLTTISVRDPETSKELPCCASGEIYISSPSVMNGYLGASEEEKDVFWTDEGGTRWIRSGDMGYLDEDGFLFLNGRIKRMIIRPDGHNVWPSQIETVITQHPSVRQCVVVGIPSSSTLSGKIPTAFIVTRNGITEDYTLLDKIHRFCRKRMPERDMAMAYLFVNEIPLTAVGKVDYTALEQMFNKQIR